MTWGQNDGRAIIHIDGDAFFVGCEQALHPEYRGKPVVTGGERGIASALSYEAKAKGVKRGMSLFEIKKICPEVIILPSDYETYSLFSKRMMAIVHRFSGLVEEYSIDECFADLTGLRQPLHKSYTEIAQSIKETVQKELGISVSVGLAPTKVLAKVASKWQKPNGFTVIRKETIPNFLKKVSVGKIWGIGFNTTSYLNNLQVFTAWDFISKDQEWVETKLSKPYQEIWRELKGEVVYEVNTEEKTSYASISKTKTFTPSSSEKSFVYAALLKNLENACIKARRHGLATKKIVIFLKQQDFTFVGLEAKVSRATNNPIDLIPIINPLFEKIFSAKSIYRATGVAISELQDADKIQGTLFDAPLMLTRWQKIYEAVDIINCKFGKHTMHLAASLKAHNLEARFNAVPGREQIILKGEKGRKRLGIPVFVG